MKKLISFVLSLVIALSVPVSVFAQEYPIYDEYGNITYTINTSDIAPEYCEALLISDTWVKLGWSFYDYSCDYNGFEILKYSPKKDKYTHVAYTKKYYYKVKNLKPSTTYHYAIRSYYKYGGAYYYGAQCKAFSVSTAPKTVKLKKVKYSAAGTLTVNIKKTKKISGYIVQYSANKKFKQGFTNTVFVSKKKTSFKLKNLGSKLYYVRICSYRNIDGIKYLSAWSDVKSATVKNGVSLKTMINAVKTNLSGRQIIKSLTNKGVDIKKYNTTYERIEAIYKWHAVHGLEFEHCLACNSNFNDCIYYLFGENRAYDSFIWIDAGNFQNRDGSLSIHKWSVLYFAGIPFIFDPRLQSYTGDYNGKLYFGVEKGSTLQKRYKHDAWYYYWATYPTLDSDSTIVAYHK